MKVKISILALYAIFALLVFSCEINNGDNNNNQNGGEICAHTWVWEVTPATDEEDGVRVEHCSKCNAAGRTIIIPAGTDSDDFDDGGSSPLFEPDGDVTEEINPNRVVGPLLTTKWSQSPPFNNLFPIVPGHPKEHSQNGRLITNCATTAWAQIINFHKHPERSSGTSSVVDPYGVTVPAVNLSQFPYDWNNIRDTYRIDGTDKNEQEKNAMARLMYHVGLARGIYTNIGSWSTQYYRMMTENFGYDKSFRRILRLFYTDTEYEALLRAQLDAGLPMYASGGGHAFVIDGYDSQGRFHINLGWRGSRDGWYYISDMNRNLPNTTMHAYKVDALFANIKPDQGGTGINEMGLRTCTANKTTVTQNEFFTVTAKVTSFGYFSGGQVGVALTDTSDTITAQSVAAVVGIADYGERYPEGSFTRTMNCFAPETVAPGDYKLRIVTRYEGGEWKIVTRSAIREEVPSSYNFTVNEETGTRGGGFGIGLTLFEASKTTVAQNEPLTVSFRLKNFGTEQFPPNGQMGAALLDNNGNIVTVLGTWNTTQLPAGTGSGVIRNINSSVPAAVSPGVYKLRMLVRIDGGEWRVATFSSEGVPTSIDLTVTKGSPAPTGGYGMAVERLTVSQSSAVYDEPFTVTTRLNHFGESFPGGNFSAALLNNDGILMAIIRTTTSSAAAREPASGLTGILDMPCSIPDTIPPGLYQIRIVVRTTGNEWRVATDSYNGSPTSVNFEVK